MITWGISVTEHQTSRSIYHQHWLHIDLIISNYINIESMRTKHSVAISSYFFLYIGIGRLQGWNVSWVNVERIISYILNISTAEGHVTTWNGVYVCPCVIDVIRNYEDRRKTYSLHLQRAENRHKEFSSSLQAWGGRFWCSLQGTATLNSKLGIRATNLQIWSAARKVFYLQQHHPLETHDCDQLDGTFNGTTIYTSKFSWIWTV